MVRTEGRPESLGWVLWPFLEWAESLILGGQEATFCFVGSQLLSLCQVALPLLLKPSSRSVQFPPHG